MIRRLLKRIWCAHDWEYIGWEVFECTKCGRKQKFHIPPLPA